ncbi:hypothetical protein CEY02_15960 [Bacillus pumilus]|uniref:Uncharacterized protein n=1 Tax=Bacillus pumilus TaxID=1408 RepID=A0A2A5IRI8_BACPU|nr:hypothetical protein CEY02_15960 [Bacillus pumilus]
MATKICGVTVNSLLSHGHHAPFIIKQPFRQYTFEYELLNISYTEITVKERHFLSEKVYS